MAGRYCLLLVCLIVLVPVSTIAGGQQASPSPSPTDATVAEPIQINASHTTVSVRGTALRDWKESPDDAAAFYRTTGQRLVYYDADTNTLHAVSRPSGRTFLKRDLANPATPDHIIPSNEQARYTDRGTIAVGTNYGPMIYDVSAQRWLTDPQTSLRGHPVEPWTATHPSAVVTADRYYVMTTNSQLLLATENWTNHVAAPPGNPERFRDNDSHVSTNARTVTYEHWVTKVGYPIIFRGAIGITDREPDRLRYRLGGPDWPIWDPLNENLTYFAPPGSGPTQVYDGTGSGTVIIGAADLVAYNLTTAEAEWRRRPPGAQWVRHGDRLIMHHRWINLTTGNATPLYADGQSMYLTEIDGTRVIGEFETVDSVTSDGKYAVVTMRGESDLGKYRARGVRIVNMETRTVTAQRVTLGRYDARWVGRQIGYRVAASEGYAVVASPTTRYPAGADSGGMAQVIDLRTNETVTELPYRPGRVHRLRATEDGLLLVPRFPRNVSRNRTAPFGRVTGNYTVYDPNRRAVVGHIPITLSRNETVGAVRVRDGDLFLFTRKDGRTIVREYDGLDESLAVTASTSDGAVVVTLSEQDGDPVTDATVELAGQRRTTNESGQARFTPNPPSTGENITYGVRIQAGGESHSTRLRVTYERASPTPAQKTENTGTTASGPGLNLLTGCIAVLSLGWLLRRRVP